MKVLAFGTGVFLRGFVADFCDRANVSITMISSTAAGDERAAHLQASGGAFTLAVRGLGSDGASIDEWRTVRSIRRALSASGDWDECLATARDPEIDVVVSNVTESALRLDAHEPDEMPDPDVVPSSFPAKLTVWLWERYGHDLPGVDILPCELIEGNGGLLKAMVLTLADHWGCGPEFETWIDGRCVFADTLVDRIVPGNPPPAEAELWRERVGHDDPLLTVAEPFTLWAIKGDGALAARLIPLIAYADGAIVVKDDITPYVFRKVRILNGLHTAMASIAPAYGVTTVREALEHSELGPLLIEIVDDEILPAICPPLEVEDAKKYAQQTFSRMNNPFLVHKLADIARGAPMKWKLRLLPTMASYEERFKRAPERLTLCRKAFEELGE